MRIRKTSIDTYRAIKESGLLSKRRFQVYDVLYEHGPMTQNECYKRMKELGVGGDLRSVTPRFAELLSRGVIETTDVRPCRVTGRQCLTFDVTSSLPSKLDTKKPLKKQLEEARQQIADLQREVVRLEEDLLLATTRH